MGMRWLAVLCLQATVHVCFKITRDELAFNISVTYSGSADTLFVIHAGTNDVRET